MEREVMDTGEKVYIVYMLTNTITNKQYIGYTGNGIEKRWKHHCYHAKRCKSRTTKIVNAILKYGEDVWIKEILYSDT